MASRSRVLISSRIVADNKYSGVTASTSDKLAAQPPARELKSIAAPVSFSDSEDDEFNPSADINKVQKTKGRRKTKDSTGSPRLDKRVSRGSGGRRPANAPRVKFGLSVPQSLQEFFGDIDSSDGEYRAPSTLVARRNGSQKSATASDGSETEDSEQATSVKAEESVTESETEDSGPETSQVQSQNPAKRKAGADLPSSPSKRQRLGKHQPLKNTHLTYAVDPDDDVSDRHVKPTFAFSRQQASIGDLAVGGGRYFVPKYINRFLRPYQREGVEFFAERYAKGIGGILADDMGLGKTIQVISFLAAIMQKKNDRRDLNRRANFVRDRDMQGIGSHQRIDSEAITRWPTCLIVAPATLVGNWQRELETWGHFEFTVYIGQKRADQLRSYQLGKKDILLTSVDIMRADIEILQGLPFSCIFVDECHNAKEITSKTYQSLKSFECTVRFGMTGTALQNKYEELWTILDFAVPGKLGKIDEWKHFVAAPLRNGQRREATDKERAISTRVAAALHGKILPQFFLRREKHDARIGLQLPQKIDKVVFCPLLPAQRNVYRRFLAHPSVRAMALSADPCDCGSGKKRSKCCHSFPKDDMLRFMDAILKISNHIVLILPDGSNLSKEQQGKAKELSNIAWPDGNPPSYAEVLYQPNFCGKWKVLIALMADWRRDPTNKVLIFTRSVRLLDFLSMNLDLSSVSFVRLDGSTPQAERMGIVDQFNTDPNVFAFLISTMAGGTGLNLTAANKVVIFDPNWNPAHDMQAMDRAYRFGQQRDVEVFRLISEGTLEENIYQRQVYKGHQAQIAYKNAVPARMFDGVQFSKEQAGELFGIKNIFTLKERQDDTRTQYRIQRAELDGLEWALKNVEGGSSDTPDLEFMTATAEEIENAARGDIDRLLRNSGVTFAVQHSELMRNDELERIQKRHLKDPKYGAEAMALKKAAERERKKSERDTHREVTGDEPNEDSDPEYLRREHTDVFESPSGKQRRPPPAYGSDPNWPPRRAHHKEPAHRRVRTDGDKLGARKKALIRKGYIKSVEDFPVFAKLFATYPAEKQRDLVLSLDR